MKDHENTISKGEEPTKIESITLAIREEGGLIEDINTIIGDIEHCLYGSYKRCTKEEDEAIDSIVDIGFLEYHNKHIVNNCNELIEIKTRLLTIFKDISSK